MVAEIESLFPRLAGTDYRVTSPPADKYNCIAWAAGDTMSWWWPGDPGGTHWPAGVPREETLAAFRAAFAALGYIPCEGSDPEPGFEKIALYADAAGIPTHAARQLTGGKWTSKLGRREDIEHSLDDLTGDVYGSVVAFLKRPLQGPPAQQPPA